MGLKILQVGGSVLTRGFRELGHRVFFFSTDECKDPATGELRDYTLARALDRVPFEPDLVSVELFGPRPLMQGLEDCPHPLVAQVFDSSFNHFWLDDYLQLFDCAFVDFKNSLPRLRELGINAHWLPYAVHPDDFKAPQCAKDIDIGFVGVTRRRLKRKALLETLQQKFDVRVAGASTDSDEAERRLTFQECAEFYARCRIVINEYLFEGINFRILEALASGAFLLTEATQNGLPDLFRDGEHLATFNSANLIERVQFYLRHDQERERIARTGREAILQHHTLKHRAAQFVNRVEPHLGGARSRPSRPLYRHAARATYHFCGRWPHMADAEIPKAGELLRRAFEQDDQDGEAHWVLGLLHARWGEARIALDQLNAASSLLPEEPLVLLHLGQLLIDLRELDLAHRCFHAALERCASAPEERIAEIQEVLQEGELGAELSMALGRLLVSMGKVAEPNTSSSTDRSPYHFHAADYFTHAYLEADRADALWEVGLCYESVGIDTLAWEAFNLLLKREPMNPELLYRSGAASLRVFRRAEGLERLAQAVQLEPALADAVALLDLSAEEWHRVMESKLKDA